MHHLRTRFLPLFPIPMSKLSHYWRIHPTVYATNLHFCPRDRWASDQVVSWQGLLFIPQYTKMTQHFSTIFPFSNLTFSILQLAKNCINLQHHNTHKIKFQSGNNSFLSIESLAYLSIHTTLANHTNSFKDALYLPKQLSICMQLVYLQCNNK